MVIDAQLSKADAFKYTIKPNAYGMYKWNKDVEQKCAVTKKNAYLLGQVSILNMWWLYSEKKNITTKLMVRFCVKKPC